MHQTGEGKKQNNSPHSSVSLLNVQRMQKTTGMILSVLVWKAGGQMGVSYSLKVVLLLMLVVGFGGGFSFFFFLGGGARGGNNYGLLLR